MCLSLKMAGFLFWVNNTCAVIPDNDPTTMIEMSQLLSGGSMPPSLVPPDDSVIPMAGDRWRVAMAVRMTTSRSPLYSKVQAKKLFGGKRIINVVISFWKHHMVTVYKAFGHLKVMPATATRIAANNRTFYKSKVV